MKIITVAITFVSCMAASVGVELPYSGLFSRGKIFANARCGDISRVKFLRMVNKELINNHTPIYFQGENIRE